MEDIEMRTTIDVKQFVVSKRMGERLRKIGVHGPSIFYWDGDCVAFRNPWRQMHCPPAFTIGELFAIMAACNEVQKLQFDRLSNEFFRRAYGNPRLEGDEDLFEMLEMFVHDVDGAGELIIEMIERGVITEEMFNAPLKKGRRQKDARVVCLIGSTRYREEYEAANREETIAGNIVVTVGLYGHEENIDMQGSLKKQLDVLHLCKIDMADEVLCIDPTPTHGNSTQAEISYAVSLNKRVRFRHEELLCNKKEFCEKSAPGCKCEDYLPNGRGNGHEL